MNNTKEAEIKAHFVEREKLNALLVHEEKYWKKRAKSFWLAEGDSNSRFFHASATLRKKANHIEFLKDDNGEVVSCHDV